MAARQRTMARSGPVNGSICMIGFVVYGCMDYNLRKEELRK